MAVPIAHKVAEKRTFWQTHGAFGFYLAHATPQRNRDKKTMFIEKLSDREHEVLALITQGKRNKEIATQLVITENTVETHLKTIFKKLCVRNRVQAALTVPMPMLQQQEA